MRLASVEHGPRARRLRWRGTAILKVVRTVARFYDRVEPAAGRGQSANISAWPTPSAVIGRGPTTPTTNGRGLL